MSELPFGGELFNVIWSEGAVFIIGMKEGLKQWKKFLKRDGFLVLTDLVWLREDRPAELTQHWKKECLTVLNIEQTLEAARQEGYRLIDHFTLPRKGWIEEFISYLEEIITLLRAKYATIKEAQETFNSIEFENEIVKKYLDYCGYEFFIWKN